MIERRHSRDPSSIQPLFEVLLAVLLMGALSVMASHQAHQTPGVEKVEVEVCR